MDKRIFVFLFFISAYGWGMAALEPLSAVEKQLQQQLELLCKTSEGHNASTHLKLAMLYHRDQEQEKGFKVYLKALELTAALEEPSSTAAEEGDYQRALHIY